MNYIIYDEEMAKVSGTFADNLAKAMKRMGEAVKILEELKTQIVWYTPKVLSKRRGVRGRAMSIKWRRS
jgi:hypothetical protein